MTEVKLQLGSEDDPWLNLHEYVRSSLIVCDNKKERTNFLWNILRNLGSSNQKVKVIYIDVEGTAPIEKLKTDNIALFLELVDCTSKGDLALFLDNFTEIITTRREVNGIENNNKQDNILVIVDSVSFKNNKPDDSLLMSLIYYVLCHGDQLNMTLLVIIESKDKISSGWEVRFDSKVVLHCDVATSMHFIGDASANELKANDYFILHNGKSPIVRRLT